jgi:hypothetical protein
MLNVLSRVITVHVVNINLVVEMSDALFEAWDCMSGGGRFGWRLLKARYPCG